MTNNELSNTTKIALSVLLSGLIGSIYVAHVQPWVTAKYDLAHKKEVQLLKQKLAKAHNENETLNMEKKSLKQQKKTSDQYHEMILRNEKARNTKKIALLEKKMEDGFAWRDTLRVKTAEKAKSVIAGLRKKLTDQKKFIPTDGLSFEKSSGKTYLTTWRKGKKVKEFEIFQSSNGLMLITKDKQYQSVLGINHKFFLFRRVNTKTKEIPPAIVVHANKLSVLLNGKRHGLDGKVQEVIKGVNEKTSSSLHDGSQKEPSGLGEY